jgi:transcriptional regulator with XRE-family HTH domain
MTASIGPTVRRRRLGTELRRLREANSIKLEEVADRLGVAPSTLSRIETGKAPTRPAYLSEMLKLYGVEDPGQRQVLIDMAREGHRKSWWAVYEDRCPQVRDARRPGAGPSLRAFESLVLHGLLQTERYARAVLARRAEAVRRGDRPAGDRADAPQMPCGARWTRSSCG